MLATDTGGHRWGGGHTAEKVREVTRGCTNKVVSGREQERVGEKEGEGKRERERGYVIVCEREIVCVCVRERGV